MGRFSVNFKDAEITESGTRFEEGDYVGEIIKCVGIQTRKAGEAFIAEFKILEAKGEGANAVGTTASFFCSMLDKAIAAPNLLGFGAAVSGIQSNEKEMVEGLKDEMNDLLEKACEGKYKGTKVQIKASKRTSKENREYMRLTFSPYEEKAKKAA